MLSVRKTSYLAIPAVGMVNQRLRGFHLPSYLCMLNKG